MLCAMAVCDGFKDHEAVFELDAEKSQLQPSDLAPQQIKWWAEKIVNRHLVLLKPVRRLHNPVKKKQCYMGMMNEDREVLDKILSMMKTVSEAAVNDASEEEDESEHVMVDNAELVPICSEAELHEGIENIETEVTPLPAPKASGYTSIRIGGANVKCLCTTPYKTPYPTSFISAMGSKPVVAVQSSSKVTPARKGGHKKVVKDMKKTSLDFDRHQNHVTFGKVDLTLGSMKSYFVAKSQKPALLVEFTKSQVGEKHGEYCKALYEQCISRGLSRDDCRAIKELMVAEHNGVSG